MKTARFLMATSWVAALLLMAACSSTSGLGRHSANAAGSQQTTPRSTKGDKKQKQQDNTAAAPQQEAPVVADTLDKEEFLQKVSDNAQHGRFLTSKVKFSVEVGNRQMTLTGNLKMKRDDVIRLQLMAFGFVEAGRLEFTKEYVLIVDRINKQYLKVPYAQLSFLRNSNIDFNMLQALFWNELFQPGKSKLDKKQLKKFSAEYGVDNDVVVSMRTDKLSYRWLTGSNDGRIKMANILYNDQFRGNYQLNWDYQDFKAFERKMFPTHHIVGFNTPDKDVKFDMILNYMGADSDWETRTELSGKYRQMPVDDILRRFMSL